YEIKAAFGVVIVCVAFATTIEVMMATTVANRITPGRENFCIRIVIAFILFGFSFVWVFLCVVFNGLRLFGLSAARHKLFVFTPGWEDRAGNRPKTILPPGAVKDRGLRPCDANVRLVQFSCESR